MRRHELTGREWKRIQPHVLGKPGTAGGTGRHNRRFVNAVVYRVRTGCARRFRRWAQAGVWETIFQAVQEPDYGWVLVDSTTVKAHKAAAGQKKARPPQQA